MEATPTLGECLLNGLACRAVWGVRAELGARADPTGETARRAEAGPGEQLRRAEHGPGGGRAESGRAAAAPAQLRIVVLPKPREQPAASPCDGTEGTRDSSR